MITIILGALIGLIYNLIQAYKERGMTEFIDYFMMGLGGVCFGVIIGGGIALTLPMEFTTEKRHLQLESLQDNNSVGGSFFLGSGTIEGRFKYVCYIKRNDMYELLQVDHAYAKIKYVENAARVQVTKIVPTESWINYFAFDFIDKNFIDKRPSYIFEVPQGTIKNNFNLDAQ